MGSLVNGTQLKKHCLSLIIKEITKIEKKERERDKGGRREEGREK
jgi:hypothetical protein